MPIDWAGVDHVTKVDPAKAMPDRPEAIRATDLVLVGGSDDVTAANTLTAVDRLREVAPDLPVLQEPYDGSQVTRETVEAVDAVAVAAIFNGDREHFHGKHLDFFADLARAPREVTGAGVPLIGGLVEAKGHEAVDAITEKLVPEGYVIQNPDSAAARQTNAETPLDADGVAGAALATETFYDFPVFYVEYSGTYGGPADVAAAAEQLEETTLLYGGGIDDAAKAAEILDAGADAIVVGDVFHDDVDRFLQTIPDRR